ncbi:MAG: CmcJ/NvfI family oxidoreductase [Pseudomonadota bacterium]
MNQIAQITRHAATDVTAPLTFIVPQDEKPKFHSQALTGGAVEFFFDTEAHPIVVEDLRPDADSFTMDGAGFAFRSAPTVVQDLYDDDTVEGAYFDEIQGLLKGEFGASHVAIFDATRRSDGGAGAANKDGNRGPASRIHVDYTAKSGPQRALDVLGAAEYERLMAAGARIVQVNVWRPIVGPVQRSPLALADARSVAPQDLVATDQVFPDRVGEIYHLAYNPAQRWYYAPEMTADEVLLIKGWDSVDDGRARFTPHTAFPLPDQDGAPARESIEVRAFVLIE